MQLNELNKQLICIRRRTWTIPEGIRRRFSVDSLRRQSIQSLSTASQSLSLKKLTTWAFIKKVKGLMKSTMALIHSSVSLAVAQEYLHRPAICLKLSVWLYKESIYPVKWVIFADDRKGKSHILWEISLSKKKNLKHDNFRAWIENYVRKNDNKNPKVFVNAFIQPIKFRNR